MAEDVKITFSGDDASLLAAARRAEEQLDRLKATLKEAGISQSAYNKAVADSKKAADDAKRAEDERIATMQKQMAAFAAVQKQKAAALAQQERERMSWTELKSKIDLASQALQKIKQFYNFSKEGAQIEFTAIKFDRLAKSIGSSGDAMMDKLKVATRGTLSDVDAMAAATDILSLGLAKTEEQAIRLAAVQSGLAMDTNQMVLALTNQTTMRFDQLGLAVDGFDEKVKALEKTGMSTQDAFTEAFLRQAEEQLLKVGHAADTDAGKFMKFEAQTENLKNQLKMLAAQIAGPVVGALAEGIAKSEEWGNMMDEIAKKHGMTSDQLARARAANAEFNEQIEREIELLQMTGVSIDTYSDRFDKMNQVVAEGAAAYSMTEDEFKSFKSELDVILRGDLAQAQEDLNSKVAEYQKQLKEARTQAERTEILGKIQAETRAYNERATEIAFNIQQEAILNSQMPAEQKLSMITALGQAYGMYDEKTANAINKTNEWVSQLASGAISEEAFLQHMRDINQSLQETVPLSEDAGKGLNTLHEPTKAAAERSREAAMAFGDMKTSQAEMAEGLYSEGIPAVMAAKAAINQLESKQVFVDIFIRRHGGGGGGLGGLVFDLWSDVNEEGWDNPNDVGGQATGGTLGAGWTLVGEQGPELISPTGYVYTHNQTRGIMSGGLNPGRRRAVGGPIASPLLRLESEGPPPTQPIIRTPPPRVRVGVGRPQPGGPIPGGGSDSGGSSQDVAVETAAAIAGAVQAAVQQAGAANTAVVNAAVNQGEKLDRTNNLLQEILLKLPGVQDNLANDLYLQSLNS